MLLDKVSVHTDAESPTFLWLFYWLKKRLTAGNISQLSDLNMSDLFDVIYPANNESLQKNWGLQVLVCVSNSKNIDLFDIIGSWSYRKHQYNHYPLNIEAD